MTEAPSRKRRRSTYELAKAGAFGTIPPTVSQVSNIFAYGKWEFVDHDNKYTIEMKKLEGKPYFQCNCSDGENGKVDHCKHINTVILSICLAQAERSDKSAKEREIVDLMADFNSLMTL